jgi:hypothetical protein
VQQRAEQVQVAVPVGGFEVPGDLGHDPGGGRPRRLLLVLVPVAGLLPGRLTGGEAGGKAGGDAGGDAIAQQELCDLLARRLPGDPHIVQGGAGVDEQSHGPGPVAWLAGLLAAADGGERQRGRVEPGVAGVDLGPASSSSRPAGAFPW